MSDRPPIRSAAKRPDASDVYQRWLDETSDLLLAGDAAGFASFASLPFAMRTVTGERIFETHADLEADMDVFVGSLKTNGVTHYIRLVKKARYLNPEMIEGFHTTYTLRNAVTVVPSYSNRMVLRRSSDGAWRVTEAEHELVNRHFPVDLARSKAGSFDEKWAQTLLDIRREHTYAEPLYQAYLHALDAFSNADNFDEWARCFIFPHRLHMERTDHVINTPEDLRPIFDAHVSSIKSAGADRVERRATRAEFLAADRIIGYHDLVYLNGDEVISDSVTSRLIITLQDGAWRASDLSKSISDHTFNGGQVGSTRHLPTLQEIQKRMSQ